MANRLPDLIFKARKDGSGQIVFRACRRNGWSKCRHWHYSPEAALDCLEDSIARA